MQRMQHPLAPPGEQPRRPARRPLRCDPGAGGDALDGSRPLRRPALRPDRSAPGRCPADPTSRSSRLDFVPRLLRRLRRELRLPREARAADGRHRPLIRRGWPAADHNDADCQTRCSARSGHLGGTGTRLTTTLLLWFIYVGYLMLRSSVEDEEKGARYAAVIGIVSTSTTRSFISRLSGGARSTQESVVLASGDRHVPPAC